MENIIFKVAQRDNYRQLAEWLVQVSQLPEQHCLHTWSGQRAKELQGQLLSYWKESELCYILALQEGQLVGAMGAEYDEELMRSWLHGPHVMMDEWGLVAMQLFTRLLSELPACIGKLDSFLNVENIRGRRFYIQQGFKERDQFSYEFWLTPDEQMISGDGGCMLLGEQHEIAFKQLYEALFPAAYYSAERIIKMIGMSHQVLVVGEGEAVLGFTVICAEESQSTGEIQFFGVREDCRRKGYGRRLLRAAIGWLVDKAGVSRVCLNVGEELVHAQGLYESVGFKLRFTGIGLSKTVAR